MSRIHPVVRNVLWVSLAVLAGLSLARGFVNAINVSVDFQWSAARVLLAGDDPYLLDALGDPDGLLDSAVHYGHLLYVLKLPLAFLELSGARLVWAVVNAVMAVLATVVLRRAFELSPRKAAILLLVFLASEPLRLTIGNAQTPLIVLLFTSLLALPERTSLTLLSGISYVKWSFAPPFAFFVLVRRGWRGAVVWAVPAVVGMMVFAALTRDFRPVALLRPFIRQLDGPSGVASGTADVMTLLGLLGVAGSGRTVLPLLLLAALSLLVLRTFRTDQHAIAALAIVSLVTVNHLPYDFVLLLPAFAAALAAGRGWQRTVVFGGTFYFFYLAVLRRTVVGAAALAPVDVNLGLIERTLAFTGPAWPASVSASLVGIAVLAAALVALHGLDRGASQKPTASV